MKGLRRIKNKYGGVGALVLQALIVKVSQNKTRKIKVDDNVVRKMADQWDVGNFGPEYGKWLDTDHQGSKKSVNFIRAVMSEAIKAKVFTMDRHKKGYYLRLNDEIKAPEVKMALTTAPKFEKPSLMSVVEFFTEKGVQDAQDHAEQFYNHYESNGWKVGKNKMQKWKAAAGGWITRAKRSGQIKFDEPAVNVVEGFE